MNYYIVSELSSSLKIINRTITNPISPTMVAKTVYPNVKYSPPKFMMLFS